MELLGQLFPVILYFVLIILVIVLTVLAIRMLDILKKVDLLVDDVNQKVKKLNGIFNVVDTFTDALSVVSDRIVSSVVNGISKVFKKKKGKDGENE